MERSGMRWTLVGAKAVLNLRAVIASGHWDEFQTHRRRQELEQKHPNRALLQSYHLPRGVMNSLREFGYTLATREYSAPVMGRRWLDLVESVVGAPVR